MSVTHIFVPTTIIASAEVNQNYTDCEDGTAMDNVTNDIAMANNTKIYFKNLAGVNDCLIHEDISDNLVLKLGTAGKYTIFKKHDGEVVFQIDTPIGAVYTRKGYAFRVYDVTNTDYMEAFHNGSYGILNVAAGGGDLHLDPGQNGDIIVFERMPRRNHSATTYVDSFIQRGWGYIAGDLSANLTTAVTFPIAFSSDNISVTVNLAGGKDIDTFPVVHPTDEGDTDRTIVQLEGGTGPMGIYGLDVLTTGFDLGLSSGGSLDNDIDYVFTWIAIGPA